ncbi:MAG: hypothetical protein ACR2QJ_12925, partial [Geminicoccaceae bacterium]
SVGENKPDRSDKTPSNIELPILQLVCSELWKRSVDENTNTLRFQNYQTIGGADQILGDFVHDVMPKQWHQQLLTARLMGRLAPPSGFKSSYAVADIADAEPELAKDDIEAELDRLEGRRILKARPSAAGKRYELQHDAFIKVIRPWRASVLAEHEKQASRRRIIFRSLGALAVVSAASYFPITGWIAEQKVYETTEGALTDLEGRNEETNDAEREVVIDNVASFMLRRESYQDFRSLMKKYVHLIPPYYGSNTTLGLDFIKLPEFGWPYVLQYSEDRPLNSWHFALEWRRQAQFAAEDWGLPFPSNFYLDRSAVLSNHELHIHSDEAASILLQDIKNYEDLGIIYSQVGLPDTGKEIIALFVDEWKEVPSFAAEEPWLAVPRWSLPIWKNIGHPASDGSGLTAVLLAGRFFDHPEFLLTPEVTRMLLDHLSDQYPATVDEARSARGDRLSEDLVEIVRRGIPLTNLPFILETIALLPDADSIATADQVESIYYGFSNGYDVVSDLRGSWATDLDSGTKPHLSDADIGAVHEERRAGAGGSLDDESGEDDQPIDDVQTEALALFDAASHTRIDPVRQSFLTIAPWLNLTREPIRVFAGDALYDAWTIDGRLTPELVEAAESVKDDVFRASGIELSGPIFSPASGTYTPLEPWQFRLEFLGDQLFWVDPFETAAETAVEDFSEAFAYQIEENRAYVSMLDMEYVGVIIDLLPEPLSQWLYRHYSLSDLTILLRTVAGKPASQSENSIRFLPWLLGSLPFWSTQIDLLDQNEVVDRLQRTQRARVERAPASGAVEDERIVDGIQALNDGRIANAVRLFRPATMENANVSEAAFLHLYVGDFDRRMDEEIGLACGDINSVFLDRSQRLLLENRVASMENETQPDSLRLHELCLLAAYNPTSQQSRFAYRKGALLTQLDEVADWRANDLVDFAEILIRTTDITGNHHQDRDRISEMMR